MTIVKNHGYPDENPDENSTNANSERRRLISGNESGRYAYRAWSRSTSCDGDLISEAESTSCHSRISVWEASWCISNLLQGLPVIGLPFTVVQGGYWALGAIIISGALTCFTGKLLIDCLYDRDEFGERIRVRRTYADIAADCMGPRLGPMLVNVALLTELMLACTIFVIICSDLLHSFVDFDVRLWILIVGALVLGYAFLIDIKYAAWISTACMGVHGVMLVVVLGYCFSKTDRWQLSSVSTSQSFQTIALSAGVIMTSNMGHSVFPLTEGSMAKPEKFTPMLTATYVVASVVKLAFAYIPFITFGTNTHEEITNNLPEEYYIKPIVNAMIILRGLMSYSLVYITVAELLTDSFFARLEDDEETTGCFPPCFRKAHPRAKPRLKWWAVLARMGVISVTVVIAIVMPSFAIVSNLLVALCSSLVAIIWPCIFHVILFKHRLNYATIALEIFLAAATICYSGTTLVVSLMSLTEKYKQ